MSHEMIMAVPTNVITGSLGAGKTTFIQQLLKHKPAHERWAVLVNEFGEIGIDGTFLASAAGQGIYVKEVPGGCMCCASGLTMQIALNRLLQQAKPHRLIIEPTGLGHPAEVLAALQAPHYQEALNVCATFTLVDARKVSQQLWREHPSFQEQLKVADCIVATKSDRYGEDDYGHLLSFLDELHLPHQPVIYANKIVSVLSLLEKKSGYKPAVDSHAAHHGAGDVTDIAERLAKEGQVRITNHGAGYFSYGWAFSAQRCFDFHAALMQLGEMRVERLKAVLITDCGIFAFNIVDGELNYSELDEVADSRLEFICADREMAKKLARLLDDGLFLS
jgi:G3E family GTPase